MLILFRQPLLYACSSFYTTIHENEVQDGFESARNPLPGGLPRWRTGSARSLHCTLSSKCDPEQHHDHVGNEKPRDRQSRVRGNRKARTIGLRTGARQDPRNPPDRTQSEYGLQLPGSVRFGKAHARFLPHGTAFRHPKLALCRLWRQPIKPGYPRQKRAADHEAQSRHCPKFG